MLTKRIIPCLDIKDGRTVKGVNFVNLRDAGDPIELAQAYSEQGADELVFLDITATVDRRKTLAELVERIARVINIPFTVGGGIKTEDDVRRLLESGADKVSVNSALVRQESLVSELASRFGSQCIVAAIDTNLVGGEWYVFLDGGRTPTDKKTLEWARYLDESGAGEILLTSMADDGTQTGFGVEITRSVSGLVNIPVIASGGAGSVSDFVDVLSGPDSADAALAASLFHFGTLTVPQVKDGLRVAGLPVR